MTIKNVTSNVAIWLLYGTIASNAFAESMPMKSLDEKIRNAMSAAPQAIAKDASVRDWPEKEGMEPPLLRKGESQWTCFPDYPVSPGNDPMCLDAMSTEWVKAWIAKKPPQLKQPGIAYMLQGGSDPSNDDPFAQAPQTGTQWVSAPPHIMIFPAGDLDSTVYGSEHAHGTPWVMFAGTPYEHLMIPVK